MQFIVFFFFYTYTSTTKKNASKEQSAKLRHEDQTEAVRSTSSAVDFTIKNNALPVFSRKAGALLAYHHS